MTLGTALYTYLISVSALTALLGRRIYPMVVPQKVVMPAITWQKISDPQLHASGTDSGPYGPRYQISCWDTNYEDAVTVAAAVKTALRDYDGTMGGAGGVVVQRVFLEDETDLFDEETKRCGIALDFIIWHD